MIRSLRRKFILIAMLSLLGTMTVLCAAIGVGDHIISTARVDRAISLLYQNGGTFLPPTDNFDPSALPAAHLEADDGRGKCSVGAGKSD